jgi:hypothetical protein
VKSYICTKVAVKSIGNIAGASTKLTIFWGFEPLIGFDSLYIQGIYAKAALELPLYISHIKPIRSQVIADVALLFLVACMVPCKQPIKTENLSDHNPF